MSKRYAITIGINDYEIKPLSFCAKDASNMAQVFTEFCNVDDGNLRIIKSEKTKPNGNIWETFVKTIEALSNEFQYSNDDIFFYFSGHGIPANETTVIFKDKAVTISEIIAELEKLSPKTKILIFDSCYSGIGYPEADKSAQFFSLSSKKSTGYYIISASSADEKAKESIDLQNGRFTYFLISAISDLVSYDEYECLDVNTLFSKVDSFFKSNPHFDQSPFQQVKSIGSYPLANSFESNNFYARHDIDDPSDFNWASLLNSFNRYLSTKESVKGEFLRLAREHFDNVASSSKGNSTVRSIEVMKNRITFVDDGTYFNLFDKNEGVKAGGGIKTAQQFLKDFGDFFSFKSYTDNGLNFYDFYFKELGMNEICQINVSWKEVYDLNKQVLDIPDECDGYTIRFENYVMMRSLIKLSINNFLSEAQRHGKTITLEFNENDRLVKETESFIREYNAQDWIKIKLYKD
ncbi:caspase family protein [Flavobacterium wongokense]|uniref:caspase family protein n=1 Tax=Flavobacterium wongokense TaxID=2910674 RepID=UPI001F1FC71C|nr:caspase family protein [Flavobacterium sp. WG47]MCF6132502.1 caspase family protein [Flavobacterium sp. WG47]